MSEQSFAVRHIDLSAFGEDTQAGGRPALSIFWWKDLPLGMRASLADELPLGRAHLAHLTAHFASEQRAARGPTLDTPLRATFEGEPKQRLTLEDALAAHDLLPWLEQLSIGSSVPADELTIIICTRDRGEAVADCLTSIAAQRSPAGELVVVDNSADGSARSVCDRYPNVRYVHEPRPGLSVARNAGIRVSTRPFVAFTDDDVEPHPGWTAELMRAFAGSDADALTGLVLPVRLDTAAQRFFQFEMGGFGTKFVPTLFESNFFKETRPAGAHVWRIGAGANMAFRRTAFERAGLFDERLGAGASGCSEDSEFWYRLLAMGGTCLYEPRAVVFHNHREDWPGLKRQMRDYMRGHVSALVVQYDNFRDRGNLNRIFKQLPRYFARTAIRTILEARPERRRILIEEILGWAAGLRYLLRLGWRRRRADRLVPTSPSTVTGSARMIAKSVLGDFLRRNPFPNGWTDGLFYREKMRAIHRVAPSELPSSARILEIGGGRSGMASFLYPDASIINLDIDFDLGGQQPAGTRSTFVCADACRLPFPDECFDVVTLFDVLEHIPNDRYAAREALRVTRPAGHVLVSTPDAHWRYPYYRFMRPISPPETELMQEWGHVRRGYLPLDLTELFGYPAERSASFINPVTAFFHDVAFSRLGARRRKLLYALAAPVTAVAYLWHRPSTRGTEAAFAWRR